MLLQHYHNPGGWWQHKFIPLEFWRPEVWDQGFGRTLLLLGALGERFLCLSCFWWLQVFLGLWQPHCCSASVSAWPSLLCPKSSSPFLFRDTHHWFRSWSDSPGWPHLKVLTLITPAESFFLNKVLLRTFISSGGWDVDTSLWGPAPYPAGGNWV